MTITVNNRELLRNYKALRDKLVKGLIDEIEVPQGHELVIKLVVERKKTPAQKFLEKVRKNPIKIKIERPKEDLFDLLQ